VVSDANADEKGNEFKRVEYSFAKDGKQIGIETTLR